MENYNKKEYLERLIKLFDYIYFLFQIMTLEKAIKQQEDFLNTCQNEEMFSIFQAFYLHYIKQDDEENKKLY